MNGKELKRLRRRELVDILYQMKKNEEDLLAKIASLEEALADKRLHIANAGSIAQAGTEISGVLLAAQTSADLYLGEICAMKEDARRECEMMLCAARVEAKQILDDALAKANAPADTGEEKQNV